MSMSQEEIESLMNGLDISENENSKNDDISEEINESKSMSEDDIAALIAETDLSNSNVEEDSKDNDEESIDDLLAELENSSENKDLDNESIDDLLAELENGDSKPIEEPTIDEDNSLDTDNSEVNESSIENNVTDSEMDDLDSLINNIDSDDEKEVDTSDIDDLIKGLSESDSSLDENDYLKDLDDLSLNEDAESLDDIDKVVESDDLDLEDYAPKDSSSVLNVEKINIPNQLGQVANDSEEKATKIFDALSYILDDNDALRKIVKNLDEFIQAQQKVLETLNKKFPNVKEFSDNLEMVNELIDKPKDIQTRLHNRDKELYDAMELMQFHDINRQKIERVMNIVINLSKQLNDIFEDSANSQLPTSKHLPGDTDVDLVGNDDLESLIAEFGK